MEPTYRFPASPGTPLFPVSPERANQQNRPALRPTSPSGPDFIGKDQSACASDVQNKVAQFNSLNKDAAERRRVHEAALRRALMGREEAESENRRMKEELRNMRREAVDGKDRERRVAERLETLMEEVHRTKETQAHAQTLYEKEIRRARKETFKSSSALVKLQEDLKSTRNALRVSQSSVEHHKLRADRREQAAFKAEYNIVGVQQELDEVRQQMKKIEEQRDALHASLKEEEIARVAAEGKIALPVSHEDDEFASPRKKPSTRRSLQGPGRNEDGEYEQGEQQIVKLEQELSWEQDRCEELEEMIHFMHMECQFKCCPCRRAERKGTEFVHDKEYAREMEEKQRGEEDGMIHDYDQQDKSGVQQARDAESLERDVQPDGQAEQYEGHQEAFESGGEDALDVDDEFFTLHNKDENMRKNVDEQEVKADVNTQRSPSPIHPAIDDNRLALAQEIDDASLSDSPKSLRSDLPQNVFNDEDTFSAIPIPIRVGSTPRPLPTTPKSSLLPFNPQVPQTTTPSPSKGGATAIPPPAPTPPSAATPPHIRRPTYTTTTTTTVVPLFDTPPEDRLAEGATMSREQALEQIRQRRGRARSVAAGALTPRKQMVEGVNRRDISAPGGVGKLGGEPRRGRMLER
ncbi:MAG: hypothetical protein M1837_005402 [Sclerophora amabilis]|nr:MAG: hypothetical protein M1837_005402 [Sclerophora amabilis]